MKLRKIQGEVKLINGKRVATAEYRSWQMMKNRCLNPLAYDFKYYGGRGITVSRPWLCFNNFLADMGRKPAPDYTLERKNNAAGYKQSNCVWANRKTQARNRDYCVINMKIAIRIRRMYRTGKYRQKDLGVIFKCSQRTISLITRNVTWA